MLFKEKDMQLGKATAEVPLSPDTNKTGNVWHICLEGLQNDVLYGYRVYGLNEKSDQEAPGHRHDPETVVIDPYAHGVLSRR